MQKKTCIELVNGGLVWFMVFNATFNNISVICGIQFYWWSAWRKPVVELTPVKILCVVCHSVPYS